MAEDPRHMAIRWAIDMAKRDRMLAVELARGGNICRICLQEPTLPLETHYGNEYACQKCLKGRERI